MKGPDPLNFRTACSREAESSRLIGVAWPWLSLPKAGLSEHCTGKFNIVRCKQWFSRLHLTISSNRPSRTLCGEFGSASNGWPRMIMAPRWSGWVSKPECIYSRPYLFHTMRGQVISGPDDRFCCCDRAVAATGGVAGQVKSGFCTVRTVPCQTLAVVTFRKARRQNPFAPRNGISKYGSSEFCRLISLCRSV
jgi:hypothetical protein